MKRKNEKKRGEPRKRGESAFLKAAKAALSKSFAYSMMELNARTERQAMFYDIISGDLRAIADALAEEDAKTALRIYGGMSRVERTAIPKVTMDLLVELQPGL